MSRKKTHEKYVAEVAIKNSKVEVLEDYKGANIPILHRCKIHEITWKVCPTSILCGHGCCLCGGNVKKTHEQYVDEVKTINPNVEVIGIYVNARTKILHRCKIDGYEWNVAPYVILRGDGCPQCGGNAKKDTEQYINEVSIINPNIQVLGDYINALMPVLHRCNIDGHEWMAKPANILSGYGCPECKSRMLHNMFAKSHDQYVEDVIVVNPDIEVLETYINSRTPILHSCKKDGYTWKVAPYNILTGQGCPQCQESNGERQIRQWLQNNGIKHIYQKTFANCKNKKTLPFDFYLPDNNMCIEYDGRQHFEPIDFAGKGEEWALKQFEQTQFNDDIKTEYCRNNNIQLLRIPYFKNIKEELEKFLFI